MNITLYHGSKNGLNGKIQPISRKLCDFGQGFYMGTSMEQPSTLICNYSGSILYTLELDDSNLKTVELPHVAITQKACNAIKIIDEKKFSTKER